MLSLINLPGSNDTTGRNSFIETVQGMAGFFFFFFFSRFLGYLAGCMFHQGTWCCKKTFPSTCFYVHMYVFPKGVVGFEIVSVGRFRCYLFVAGTCNEYIYRWVRQSLGPQ